MKTLFLYNSLSRAKQAFAPIDPGHVRLYACGPTVYNYAHIGNARMAVVFDLLSRTLRSIYPKVTYVSNITDIDDKIIDAARETGADITDITVKFGRIYNEDMENLGVRPPDVQPLATTHVGQMIDLIQILIDGGKAYAKDGHVLFNVPSYAAYGQLSGRSRDDQIAGARVEVAPYKKDPADFVLWKPSSDDQPGWDSPWGRGRPGWHIECSAMAEAHLGLPFDIHGGGADLKFPHHENEIAQSCAAHNLAPEDFARVWVHNGFVTVNGEKMSKSLGNFLLAHDLLKDWPGEAIRLTLLSAHYRQPLDWSEDKLRQSKKLLDKLYTRLEQMEGMQAAPDTTVPAGIMEALCDDLNTPQVMAELNVLLKDENSPRLKAELLSLRPLLGLLNEDPATWLAGSNIAAAPGAPNDTVIEGLLEERRAAKAAKDFGRADAIRGELTAMGIAIEDTPAGTIWKRA
ncbi:MAG TPA: cysteine--tRNA ligase [Alphaproteobacteria bacterium]|nr:cysteine--tRNA ligase [Alphaproteobacteria bacterium]